MAHHREINHIIAHIGGGITRQFEFVEQIDHCFEFVFHTLKDMRDTQVLRARSIFSPCPSSELKRLNSSPESEKYNPPSVITPSTSNAIKRINFERLVSMVFS